MNKEDSIYDLKASILQLEKDRAAEVKLLKEQVHQVYESVKPANLIKSTFKEVSASQGLKDNMLNIAIGLTAGYLAKLMFVGFSKNPVKKLLGNAILVAITNTVTKNPETIKSLGTKVLRLISNARSRKARIL